jgi:hypothetical protein
MDTTASNPPPSLVTSSGLNPLEIVAIAVVAVIFGLIVASAFRK